MWQRPPLLTPCYQLDHIHGLLFPYHWEQGWGLCSACCHHRAESTIVIHRADHHSCLRICLKYPRESHSPLSLLEEASILPNPETTLWEEMNISMVDFSPPPPTYSTSSLLLHSPACSWTDSHPHFWKVFSMDIAFYLLHNIKMSPLFVFWHE